MMKVMLMRTVSLRIPSLTPAQNVFETLQIILSFLAKKRFHEKLVVICILSPYTFFSPSDKSTR